MDGDRKEEVEGRAGPVAIREGDVVGRSGWRVELRTTVDRDVEAVANIARSETKRG